MTGAGIVAGLADSAFIADVDARDRAAAPIATSIALGLLVAAIAATAATILVLASWTLLTGHGQEGLAGLGRVLEALQNTGPPTLRNQALDLFLVACANGVGALAFVAVAAVFARRPLHSYLTAAPQVRWRLLGIGLILGALALAPVLLLDRIVSGADNVPPLTSLSPDLLGRLAYVLVSMLFIPAAAAEEIFFRGWLLRLIAAFSRRPAYTIVGTAVVFAIFHFDFSPDSLLTRTLMGAGFAYMTLRLGGIEFSTAVHATNNILIILFVAPLPTQAPDQASGITAASLIVDLAMVAGYLAITEIVARSPSLRRWAGVRVVELSPASATGRLGGSSSPLD